MAVSAGLVVNVFVTAVSVGAVKASAAVRDNALQFEAATTAGTNLPCVLLTRHCVASVAVNRRPSVRL